MMGQSVRLSYSSVLAGMSGRDAYPSHSGKGRCTSSSRHSKNVDPLRYLLVAQGGEYDTRWASCATSWTLEKPQIDKRQAQSPPTSIERGPSAANSVFVKTALASSLLMNKPRRRSFDDLLEVNEIGSR